MVMAVRLVLLVALVLHHFPSASSSYQPQPNQPPAWSFNAGQYRWPPKRARENVNYLFGRRNPPPQQPPPPNYAFAAGDPIANAEPSCEQLRAMWRLSKRAAQHSLLTNEIPPVAPDGMMGGSGGGRGGGGGGRGTFGYVVKSPPVVVKSPVMTRPSSSSSSSSSGGGRGRNTFGKILVDTSPRPPPPSPQLLGSQQGRPSGGTGFDEVAHELFAEKPFRHVGVGHVIKPDNKRPLGPYGAYVRPPSPVAAIDDDYYGPYNLPPPPPPPPQQTPANSRLPYDSYQRGGGGAYNGGGGGSWGVLPDSYQQETVITPRILGLPVRPSQQQQQQRHRQQTTSRRPNGKSSSSSSLQPAAFGSFETVQTGFNTDASGCEDINTKFCRTNDDCSCYGFYMCVKGRCRNKSSPSTLTSKGHSRNGGTSGGTWHQSALDRSELGAVAVPSSRRKQTNKAAAKQNRLLSDRKKVVFQQYDDDFEDDDNNNDSYNNNNNNNKGFGSWS